MWSYVGNGALRVIQHAQKRRIYTTASSSIQPCFSRRINAIRRPLPWPRILNGPSQRRYLNSTPLLRSPQPAVGEAGRPLDGITVISLEQAIAAPFCTRQLADLGARVIKVERPEVGDFARDYDTRVEGLSSHFVWCNRSKESLALDLKNSKDLAVLKQLLETADVLVQNLAPGASGRLGLGYEALQKTNPAIIVCDISGYGSDGPYRTKKAYDLLIQSEAGVLSVCGTKDQPAKVGISIADIAAGMYAYTNILAALIQRGKTGQGCRLDISMLESIVEWMSFPIYYSYKGAAPPVPVGAAHATIFPYGPFDTGDGRSVMLGLQNEREFRALCEKVLGDASLATDPRFATNLQRLQNQEALRDIIHAAFSSLSADETVVRLDEAGIANAKVNDMHAVWKHPQLLARQRWTKVDTPVGEIPALLPPGMSPAGVHARMDAVPAVGEHNEAILAELKMKSSK